MYLLVVELFTQGFSVSGSSHRLADPLQNQHGVDRQHGYSVSSTPFLLLVNYILSMNMGFWLMFKVGFSVEI